MGLRHWVRKRIAEDEAGDVPPKNSLLHSLFGKDPPTLHALGEYDAASYPQELEDLLRRRGEVAQELVELDLTHREGRVAAIPRLQQLLRTYPHPVAYDALIIAYIDAGRWDDARGAAFAARQRRAEVTRSPYPEIRAEIDRLSEWTTADVEEVRREREAASGGHSGPA